jgi:signal transduction histidine kinase
MLPKMKLKNQLALVSALSKALIIVFLTFTIPWLVGRIAINDTDANLEQELDEVFFLIDSLGIDDFFDSDADFKAFGSYNILKEEYISIENLETDTLINSIAFSQRIIDEVLVDYRVLSYSFILDGEYYIIEIGKSITTILQFEKQLKRFAIIFMLILLAVTVIIEISLIQYLLRPLDLIVRKLKDTANPSSFNYEKIKTGTSDFRYLEDTLHHLMRKIEETFNNEREYIGNVSHELLTPVSIIKSKLDNIIMEGNLAEEDMLKVYESKQTLGRLTKMIRTLLTLSRIENEEYLLKDDVDAIETVKNVISELEDRIQSKQLLLEMDWQVPQISIKGNQELLFNMFYNLLNNAIKYTHKGFIKIESRNEKGKVQLIISDSGEGIDSNLLPYIFSRFRSFKTGKDNFGLGLALAKKICDYHNIEVKVTSEVNNGSQFQLIFNEPKQV